MMLSYPLSALFYFFEDAFHSRNLVRLWLNNIALAKRIRRKRIDDQIFHLEEKDGWPANQFIILHKDLVIGINSAAKFVRTSRGDQKKFTMLRIAFYLKTTQNQSVMGPGLLAVLFKSFSQDHDSANRRRDPVFKRTLVRVAHLRNSESASIVPPFGNIAANASIDALP